MRYRMFAVIAVVALAAVLVVPAGLARSAEIEKPAPKAEGKALEDRVLEAELAEIGSGELAKARAVYEAVAGDEAAPAELRARARLGLARCHRKAGEVEAARKLLEDLVKDPAAGKETLRQAKGYLKEIQTGKPGSPDFDWLKEYERNPEVQQRVFELAMDLAGPEMKEIDRAMRQLLALGSIAAPVLEKVFEGTRDPGQRHRLAMILVRAGRIERIGTVLDPKLISYVSKDYRDFLFDLPESLLSLDDEGRARLVEELKKLPPSPVSDPCRDVLFLVAGDLTDLEAKLESAENSGCLTSSIIDRVAAADPAAARKAFAARLLDPEGFQSLYCEALERRGEFETLAEVAGKEPGRKKLTNYLKERYVKRGGIERADPRWAKPLREARALYLLAPLAQMKDEAVPDLAALLAGLPKDHGLEAIPPMKGDWRPSPKYLEAMKGLLDSREPVTLIMAFEALRYAPEAIDDDARGKIEKAVEEVENGTVQSLGVQALLAVFPSKPETGPSTAGVIVRLYERAREAKPASRPRSLIPGPAARRMPQSKAELIDLGSLGNAIRVLDQKSGLAFYPHVLGVADSAAGALFHEAFFPTLFPTMADAIEPLKILIDHLEGMKSLEFRTIVMNRLWMYSLPEEMTSSPKLSAFLKGVVSDREMPPDVRMEAIGWLKEPRFDAVDWTKVFKTADPLSLSLLRFEDDRKRGVPSRRFDGDFWKWIKMLPQEAGDRIYQAALKTTLDEVRLSAVLAFPMDRPESQEVLKLAVGDPSFAVRQAAIDRLKSLSRVDTAPVFLDLLKRPEKDLRLLAVDRLKSFAVPESIEPLVKLLDDPDIGVRGAALDALKGIRSALEEKRAWEDIVKGLKPKPGQEEPKKP